ncbi:LicD family protein [Curtanaerobium respiraculi]|uniref:LicD family protein n=1 Tax=Curtanaerobium respiraculi TaxID=2949669 RepID=UPI003D1703DC
MIDRLCRDNSIDYFIDSNTCLGAIRYGGFTPWGDEIDFGRDSPRNTARRLLVAYFAQYVRIFHPMAESVQRRHRINR